MRRLAVLVLLALAGSGCMGDDSGEGSLEDYIARADGICGEAQIAIGRLPRPVTGDPTELGIYLERALPIARKQLEDVRALTPPADEVAAQRVDRMLQLLEQELDLNVQAQEAAEKGDRGAVQTALGQAAPISAEAGRLSEELGFVVCARRL